jgi:prepilin-type N-terminal cleavage/methylation domain-containing protein/prepilin-type processing-associated H-X9-DG protein
MVSRLSIRALFRHSDFVIRHLPRSNYRMLLGGGEFHSATVCGRVFASAFTLVELLIVIGIIGLLAGLLLPALSRAKESGRSTACLSNLHQIGLALQLYVQDNQNTLPTMYDWSTNLVSNTNGPPINLVLSNYIGSSNVFRCPSERGRLFELTGSSYSWNSLLNGQDADHLRVFNLPFDPHQIPVVYDKEKFHIVRGNARAVNYLYADGHIKNLLEVQGTK